MSFTYSGNEVGHGNAAEILTCLGMDSFRLYGLALAGSVATLSVYACLRPQNRRAPTNWSVSAGSCWMALAESTDGTVIDVQELEPQNGRRAATLLIYKYDVAGVSYECSQDVTHLRHWINLHSCRLGLPTS